MQHIRRSMTEDVITGVRITDTWELIAVYSVRQQQYSVALSGTLTPIEWDPEEVLRITQAQNARVVERVVPSPTVVDHTAITRYIADTLEEGYEPTYAEAVADGALPDTAAHAAAFARAIRAFADDIAELTAGPETGAWYNFTNVRGNMIQRYLISGNVPGGVIASVKYRPISNTYKFTMNGGEYRVANTIEELAVLAMDDFGVDISFVPAVDY